VNLFLLNKNIFKIDIKYIDLRIKREKILIMTKKIIVFVIFFSLIIMFTGCSNDIGPDISVGDKDDVIDQVHVTFKTALVIIG